MLERLRLDLRSRRKRASAARASAVAPCGSLLRTGPPRLEAIEGAGFAAARVIYMLL